MGCGLGFLSCVSAEFYKNARITGIDTFDGPPPVDPYFASIPQFDAPLASLGALQPLTPATAYTDDGAVSVVVSPDGHSAYVVKPATPRFTSTTSIRLPAS